MESTQPLSSSYRDKAQPEGDAQDRGFSGFYSPVQKPGAGSQLQSELRRQQRTREDAFMNSRKQNTSTSSILKNSGDESNIFMRSTNLRSPKYDGGAIKLSELGSPGNEYKITARDEPRRYSGLASPGSVTKSVRFDRDLSEPRFLSHEPELERPTGGYFRSSENETSHRSNRRRLDAKNSSMTHSDASYSREYVDQIRKRYKNEISEFESKYKLLCREYEEYKSNTRENVTSLNKQLEAEASRHIQHLEKTRREVGTESDKKALALEYDNKLLRTRIKEQDHMISETTKRMEQLQIEFKQQNQSTTSDLSTKVRALEEQSKIAFQTHDSEKKKLKESYEELINDLSSEIKQLYEKMNQEMHRKERKITDLDRELSDVQKKCNEKLRQSEAEHESLNENNRYQRQILEENKNEILRLNELLDEKKKQVYLIESKMELGKSTRSLRNDSVGNSRHGSEVKSPGTVSDNKKSFYGGLY